MQFKNPVFIVGYPRSGTTLLYHIIMSSDDFPEYPFSETHYFTDFYKRYGSLHNSKNMKHFLENFIGSECFMSTNLEAKLFLKKLYEKDITYGSVFLTFMELFSSCNGKIRWLEKTPWHMLFVPQILKVVPQAKFINIVRDGRDVALSICKARFMKHNSLIKASMGWKWHLNYVEKYLKKFNDKILTIKYEELVLSPNDVINKLSSFLNVDISINEINSKKLEAVSKSNSSFKDVKGGISTAPVNRWRTNLSENDLSQVQYIINETLKKNDYIIMKSQNLNLICKIRLKVFDYLYSTMKFVQLFIRKVEFVLVKD